MNFFGHAWLAAGRGADAGGCDSAFVFGAMLPDLAPMAGGRIAEVDSPDLEAGIAFHIACDAVFHSAPAFRSLLVESSHTLEDAGVRRGPARGAAHVGIELLLDGWIAKQRGVPAAYHDALAAAPAYAARVHFTGTGAYALKALCARVAASDLPLAYADPPFTAARVERALSRRRRLALTADEPEQVAHWLSAIGPELGRKAGALLDSVAVAVRGDARAAALA